MKNVLPSCERIIQTATGFWASKVLLSAVDFGLFSTLGKEGLKGKEIENKLGFHPRATFDFLDALVALKFLQREGCGEDAVYKNTAETGAYLDKASPNYMGGMLEMINSRLFGYWAKLDEGIKTGQPQNGESDTTLSRGIFAEEGSFGRYLNAMDGFQAANFSTLAEKFDFSKYKTVADIGGGQAKLAITLAQRHPHLKLLSFDLPPVSRYAQDAVDKAHVGDRVTVASGDFLKENLPKADVITMGNILQAWNTENKRFLIKKAYDALPQNGAFVVVEAAIDEYRRQNATALLTSLNMMLEYGDGYNFTCQQFFVWCQEAGFSDYVKFPLVGGTSAVIACKRTRPVHMDVRDSEH